MNYKWSKKGPNIRSDKIINLIQSVLEKGDPILVKHWFYCGARCPEHKAFDYYEDFIEYLDQKVNKGDIIDVWNLHNFEQLKGTSHLLATGKEPNENGETPEGGAY